MDAVTNQPQVAQAGGHHHHHHGGGKNAQAINDALSKALGMSADDLRTARQQGKSLADLAAAKGLSTDDLTKAVSQAVQQSDPKISQDRANQIASAIVTGARAGQGPQDAAGGGTGADVDGDHDGSGAGGFSKLASATPASPPDVVNVLA